MLKSKKVEATHVATKQGKATKATIAVDKKDNVAVDKKATVVDKKATVVDKKATVVDKKNNK